MPISAEDRLVLIRVKVERAKDHLRDLEGEVLGHERHYVVIGNKNPSSSFDEIPGLISVPVMSFATVCIAGDIVHNLRASLDHLAHQLVLVGSPGTVPTRRVEFPIAETFSKYEASKAGKIEGMRADAVDAIDRLKPYKGGNDDLWRIHELDNIDKHRTLFTVDHDVVFTAGWLSDDFMVRTQTPHFAGVETAVERDIQTEIEKAIAQTQITKGKALLPSLHELVNFAENLVLNFEPFLE